MGHWTELRIDGKSCELFEPDTVHKTVSVILYLHARESPRLRDLPKLVALFEQQGLFVLAPSGGRCWWVNKQCPDFGPQVTPEYHLVNNVLPFITDRWSAPAPRVGLMGIGMGGQGALRLAYKYPNKFPVVAAVSPSVDFQILYDDDEILQAMYADPEAARQDTAILYIHPLNWPRHQFFCCDPEDSRWWDGVDRLRMKLYSLGVPHECDLETSFGGRSSEYQDRMAERAVKFIVDRLEQESRRAPP